MLGKEEITGKQEETDDYPIRLGFHFVAAIRSVLVIVVHWLVPFSNRCFLGVLSGERVKAGALATRHHIDASRFALPQTGHPAQQPPLLRVAGDCSPAGVAG